MGGGGARIVREHAASRLHNPTHSEEEARIVREYAAIRLPNPKHSAGGGTYCQGSCY